ncbi:MAG: histidine phosphotransferase [Daejeonella sp.]|nr:histidine phosphotransferase [Daejeonella sp.]
MLDPIKEDSQDLEINLSYLSDIASGSSEFMIEMIDMFLEQTPGYVQEMAEAIDAKNWTLVADIAHKIKPTFAFMGLESAKDSMAEIEGKARNQNNLEEIDAAFKSIQGISKQLFVKLERVKEDLQQAG